MNKQERIDYERLLVATSRSLSAIAPIFIQVVWIQPGGYVLGLRSDGEIWKTTNPNANPLVWTKVWGEPIAPLPIAP